MRTKFNAAWFIALLAMALVARTAATPVSAAGFVRVSRLQSPAFPPAVTLRAASGATLSFETQNGDTVDGIPSETFDLPHLVLYRNGALTQAKERTLVVEVTGIRAPATGVTITLEIETQHKDPDAGDNAGQRISVWRASQRIARPPMARRKGVRARFVHQFGATVPTKAGRTATPTDYYRYRLTVTDAARPEIDPLYSLSRDHAFLLENQWIARLPEVREGSSGLAPDELIVYYADMFPFRKNSLDPNTWLYRAAVTNYVSAELLPQMVEAFRIQSDEWGFSWSDAWASRRSEDGRRLGVALSDGETWFHGPAPTNKGLSDISINVSGGNSPYDTLTDGLMSTFHHELFHNLQRSMHLDWRGSGWVSGKESAWAFFAEGTAVMASSVGQPHVQFMATQGTRDYMSYANRFVRWGGGHFQDVIANYADFDPYSAAIYWRFLYEQCGGMADGRENPAAGMAIIRRALTVLYSGEVVDIDASTDLLRATPEILDRALAGSACPFQTYKESLVAFALSVYGLRVASGRCIEPGRPAGCGLYDPHATYDNPTVRTIVFSGVAYEYQSERMSVSDIDLIDVVLAPSAEGRPLMLEFRALPPPGAEFDVRILYLAVAPTSAGPEQNLVPSAVESCTDKAAEGNLACLVPGTRTVAGARLGVIVVHLDGKETSDPTAAYTITLR